MFKIYFLLCFVLLNNFLVAQKLLLVPSLNAQYGSFGYSKKAERVNNDFKTSFPYLNGCLSFDLIQKTKKRFNNVYSLDLFELGPGLKITNKYDLPTAGNFFRHTLTWRVKETNNSVNVIFAKQIESKKFHKFIKKLPIKYDFSLGAGVILNESKAYHIEQPLNLNVIRSFTPITINYTYFIRELGYLLKASGGFKIYNKKQKAVLQFQAFYTKGLRDLFVVDYNYRYGFPGRERDSKQVIRTRGSNLGFKLGVPITLKK